MSTTNPTTTTTNGSTSTSSPSSTPSANSNTATLYLFTFLATILVLVLLSGSLVLRSYVLRRRYRQRFHQALADGIIVDLGNGAGQFDTLRGYRRSARRLGPKPVVFDTWLCPADKVDTWSSLSPVAVRYSPLLSPPSALISSPYSSLPPHTPPSSTQARTPFSSQLRIPSPFSLSPQRGRSPILSPNPAQTRSPPPAGLTSPDPASRTDNDTATLAVSVLVAMPGASSLVHRLGSDTKGKGINPHAQHQGGNADTLSLSSSCQSGARGCDEELPLLEFGVVKVNTGDWVWQI